ncbi:MAG: LuxR C-terminal-related transcriptional regulator [Anaerolineae bacterium]
MTGHNLPPQPTPFIGRDHELADIARLLADPTCRLLTLVGPGGMGKTRLAIEVARCHEMPDGAFFVPLQPLTTAEFIVHAIAEAVSIQFFQADDPKQQLLSSLQNKAALLLLDNFEHLLDGVGLLSDMLSTAPGIKLLVTSRERLNLQEEWAFMLDGLSFPKDAAKDALENYSAVQLFVQRARQARADFSLNGNTELVATICRQLEGLPLGLELAASWLRAMSCERIAAQIQSSLHFLATPLRNIPERHRSLNAVFEQSWGLLTTAEQDVLMRLSVFRGGFDEEAVEHVADTSLPVLAALVDKSFIRLDNTGRYDLHELLRQFAADKLLDAGQYEATVEAFCAYYLKLAEQVEVHNFGYEQVPWYDRAEVEWDNFRAALTWSEESERGLHMAAAMGWFFQERGYWLEGQYWLEHVLAANPDALISLRAKVLNMAAMLGTFRDSEVQHYLEQSLALSRPANDLWNTAWSLSYRAIQIIDDDLDQSAALVDESLALFRQLRDRMGLTHNLVRRSWIAELQRDFDLTQQLLDEAAVYANAVGDKILIGWVTVGRGTLASHFRRFVEARNYLENGLTLFREAHFPLGLDRSLILLGGVELALENPTAAHECYRDALLMHKDNLAYHPFFPFPLAGMAAVASYKGNYQRAVVLFGAAGEDWVKRYCAQNPHIFTFDRDIVTARAQLGDESFEQAWATGSAMTRQEATDFALLVEPEVLDNSASRPADDSVTTRERDILRLLGDGLNSREIADQLVLSVGTVRWYLKQIYSKRGVHGRSEALARARELRLLT